MYKAHAPRALVFWKRCCFWYAFSIWWRKATNGQNPGVLPTTNATHLLSHGVSLEGVGGLGLEDGEGVSKIVLDGAGCLEPKAWPVSHRPRATIQLTGICRPLCNLDLSLGVAVVRCGTDIKDNIDDTCLLSIHGDRLLLLHL